MAKAKTSTTTKAVKPPAKKTGGSGKVLRIGNRTAVLKTKAKA